MFIHLPPHPDVFGGSAATHCLGQLGPAGIQIWLLCPEAIAAPWHPGERPLSSLDISAARWGSCHVM